VRVLRDSRNAHRALAEVRLPKVQALFAADRLARFEGKEPAMIPVATLDPTEISVFPGENAYHSFQGAPRWKNEVTLRSLEMFWEHETSGYIDKIGPTPLVMIVEDAATPVAVADSRDAFNRAHEPKKLVFFHGGHFDAYVRDQVATANAARDWYLQHLS